jgi:hypothetical protein
MIIVPGPFFCKFSQKHLIIALYIEDNDEPGAVKGKNFLKPFQNPI